MSVASEDPDDGQIILSESQDSFSRERFDYQPVKSVSVTVYYYYFFLVFPLFRFFTILQKYYIIIEHVKKQVSLSKTAYVIYCVFMAVYVVAQS